METRIPGCGEGLPLLLWNQSQAPSQKQQVLSTQHVKEQPVPSPTSPLYRQRTGRGQEGTGIKVGSGQAVAEGLLIRGQSSLPWVREGVVRDGSLPHCIQPKQQKRFTENHLLRLQVLTGRLAFTFLSGTLLQEQTGFLIHSCTYLIREENYKTVTR